MVRFCHREGASALSLFLLSYNGPENKKQVVETTRFYTLEKIYGVKLHGF
jgi:hypothetical protein